MWLRPVKARAAISAIRFASVPLLLKRTRSMEGKRSQMSRASRSSASPTAARLTPRPSAAYSAACTRGSEWPNSPAVYSPQRSRYSCPSRSQSRQPSPRAIAVGKGP